jgi:hypothetical protein
MGSMSAPDAGNLPRLGEVFFDARGSSRSMRLSWYSDTGIAVFSIWQGGTCTGTFRLPMDDLSRLLESLQRGVAGSQENEATGPMALGGQRPRLALGAAAGEPFTGMMAALTDDHAAAYGRTSQSAGANGSGPAAQSDYAVGGVGEQYGSQQYGGQQYGAGQPGAGRHGRGAVRPGSAVRPGGPVPGG